MCLMQVDTISARQHEVKRVLIAALVLTLALLVLAPLASAHKVNVFAWVEGDTVHVEGYFAGKKKAQDSLVEVFDSSGEKLLDGRTNERGEFSFKIPKMTDPVNDDFLFNQGPTRGLSKIQFHDYNLAYDSIDLPNINIFKEQIGVLKEFLLQAPPDEDQRRDIDFLLTLGELFTLVAYGQLIIENSRIYGVEDDLLEQIFDFMVRDFSKYALQLYSKVSSSPQQMDFCLKMIRKPVVDIDRYERVWNEYVYATKGKYHMND